MKFPAYSRVVLLLAVVALCSGSLGGAVALRIQNHRQARHPAIGLAVNVFQERLVNQLELSPQQRSQIEPILNESSAEMRAIVTNAVSQVLSVRKRLETQLMPLLTTEQQARLQQISERRQQLRERWQRGERLTPEYRQRLRERLQERLSNRTNATPSEPTNSPATVTSPPPLTPR